MVTDEHGWMHLFWCVYVGVCVWVCVEAVTVGQALVWIDCLVFFTPCLPTDPSTWLLMLMTDQAYGDGIVLCLMLLNVLVSIACSQSKA